MLRWPIVDYVHHTQNISKRKNNVLAKLRYS